VRQLRNKAFTALLDRIREPSAGIIAELGAKNFCNQQRMSDIQPLKHVAEK